MVAQKNWRQTRKKNAIDLYASGDLTSDDHPILLMGGIHGDEPEGVELAEKTLQFLAFEAENIQVPWILIPCLNVDGYRANQRCNGAGVDINRNYRTKDWSPHFEKERYNPGPSAGSEPETQAVMDLIGTFQPRLIIHCHSWHPCIVCTGQPGSKDATRLSTCSGYPLQDSIGYDTPGSLSAYGWIENKIPVICIEEQEGTPLHLVWPHFEKGMREIFLDPSPR